MSEYLTEIGIDATRRDLDLVAAMQRAHLARFTFNSIDVLLGEALPLESDALFDKLVRRGRGGYCFEHNKLFFEALRALGFTARLGLARVLMNRVVEAPLTHRVTLLDFEDRRYLIDVGFGPLAPRGPLPLDSQAESTHDGFVYRILPVERGRFALQTILGDAFFTLYSFDQSPFTEADCELGHFYSHKHPKAVFVNNLVVSRIEGGVVHSLRNTMYRRFDSQSFVDTLIETPQDLGSILSEVFDHQLGSSECEQLFRAAEWAALQASAD